MAKIKKTKPYVLGNEEDMIRLQEDYNSVLIECGKLVQEKLSLKRQIGGYKTSNESYKRCNKEIRSANEELAKSCMENVETISKLRCSINEMNTTIYDLKNERDLLKSNCEFWKQKYEDIKALPWYKRLFRRYI